MTPANARPAPSDVVGLATRLAVPVSVDRALDELDAATLQVLDAVLLSPTDGVPRTELPGLLPDVPVEVVDAAVETLEPDPADVAGFEEFMGRYRAGLVVQRAAIDALEN